MRHQSPLTIATLSLLAALQSTPNALAEVQLETRRDPIYAARDLLWDSNRISVCWESMHPPFQDEREAVRAAIQASWSKYSNLVFTGWQQCREGSKGIRIVVKDEGPRVTDIGTGLDGKKNGMVLNFTFQNWTPSYANASKQRRISWIQAVAVHEFGHALGFVHEHNRSGGIADGCIKEPQGSTPGWWDDGYYVTPYDHDSIMNYCAKDTNNTQQGASTGNWLSPLDIIGLQRMYGCSNKPECSAFRDREGESKLWAIAYSNRQPWTSTNASNRRWTIVNQSRVSKLYTGDFDGDGKADVLGAWGGKWYVSKSATGRWRAINTSEVTDLKLGDFNGDKKTDLFSARNGVWYVSYSGISPWQQINRSDVSNVKLVDLNGDGKTDVFSARDGKWYVSYGGTSSWSQLNKSDVTDVDFGDFNGDGKLDVFGHFNGSWYYSPEGKGKWVKLNKSDMTRLSVLDLNKDRTADVLYRDNKHFLMSKSGTQKWEKIFSNSNTYGKPWHINDFDGDKIPDILVIWDGERP